MRAALLSFVAVVALSWVQTSPAADDGRRPMIYGPGQASCGSWTDSRKSVNLDSQIREAWVTGFVTGIELASPRIYSPTDGPGMFGQIDIYCLAHPLENLTSAAIDLLGHMTPK
jgi:hypothetical protein